MKTVLLVTAGGFAVYWILGQLMQSQQASAIASCGGGLVAGSTPNQCPALNAVNAKWSWFPQATLSL
jgi:hypothetical protein